ncbi:MAG: hypothetical protein RIQ81_544 [Pseudomonadota bacterium]|jgi:hypothetical protein
MKPRSHADRASINPTGVFVFKPIGTGLGLENSHQVRNAPGFWSRGNARKQRVQVAPAPLQPASQSRPAGMDPFRLRGWQRFFALWCDVILCLAVLLFAVLSAGVFLALGEDMPVSAGSLLDLVSGLSWLRHSIHVAAVAGNAPWWALLSGFGVLFGCYRLVTALLAGRSPGEALVFCLLPGR